MSDFSINLSPQFNSVKKSLVVFSWISIFLFMAEVTVKGIMREGVGIEIGNPEGMYLVLLFTILYFAVKYHLYINQEVKTKIPKLKNELREIYFTESAKAMISDIVSDQSKKVPNLQWTNKNQDPICKLNYDMATGKPVSCVLVYAYKKIGGLDQNDIRSLGLGNRAHDTINLKPEEIEKIDREFESYYKREYPNIIEFYTPYLVAVLGILFAFLKTF